MIVMNARNKLIILGLIVISVMVGCAAASWFGNNIVVQSHTNLVWEESVGTSWDLAKVYIQEDNVTCYLMDGVQSGGITCMRGE